MRIPPSAITRLHLPFRASECRCGSLRVGNQACVEVSRCLSPRSVLTPLSCQALLDAGATRVAILDIDYHHSNGTQEIFYSREDVLVVNLHGDPVFEYPFFLGHVDESGSGVEEGYNLNLPLAAGTTFEAWFAALEVACARVVRYAPDAVVVSLGVPTFKNDPISHFRLDSEDYLRVGQRIAALGLKTLFLLEGGYAVEEIGVNAVNVLIGFDQR